MLRVMLVRGSTAYEPQSPYHLSMLANPTPNTRAAFENRAVPVPVRDINCIVRSQVERLRSMVKQTEDFDVHTSLGSDAEPIYDEEGNQLDPNQVAMLRAQMLAGQEVGQLGRVPDQMLKYSNGDSYKVGSSRARFEGPSGIVEIFIYTWT